MHARVGGRQQHNQARRENAPGKEEAIPGTAQAATQGNSGESLFAHAQVIPHHPAASLENKPPLSLSVTGKVIKGFRFDTFEQSNAQNSV